MSGIIGGAGSKSGVIGRIEVDNEQGDWTLIPNSGSITGTTGRYYKVGGLVMVRGYFHTASGYTGGTNIEITGLPYPPTQDCCGALQLYEANVQGTGSSGETYNITSRIEASGKLKCLESRDSMTWHTMTWSGIGTGHFFFTITYMT